MISLVVMTSSALTAQEGFLLDDFRNSQRSVYGTSWEGFTDQVMGGKSTLSTGIREENGIRFLRMEGRVSLENNGGFIQVRLNLERSGRLFDARAYKGLRLIVRGRPGSYAVHLRTPQNWFPWNYLSARLAVTEDWSEVLVPFESFKDEGGRPTRVEKHHLRSVAVTAIAQAFEARLDVREIGFY